jgi:hypothetical protein
MDDGYDRLRMSFGVKSVEVAVWRGFLRISTGGERHAFVLGMKYGRAA